MPFRFLHTADWQMGMRAAGLGVAAEAVRQERLAAAERVVAAARQHEAECIVISGDAFEDNGVEPVLVQRVADILGRSPCPVLILPGNHDPLSAGSVYDREVWARARGVTVWRSAEPWPFRPGVSFHPCPYLGRRMPGEGTAPIRPREPGDDTIRIGVAHGALRGLLPAEDESACPIDPGAPERCGLDYLALGHWHSTLVQGRLAYAGSHEATRFGERDSGNVLIVEVAERGAPPAVRAVRTGALTWRQEVREVGSLADFEALLGAFDREDPQAARGTLIELSLRGVAPAEVMARVAEDLQPLLQARFLFARLVADGLVLQPTEAELLALAPAGPVRTACEQLLQQAAEAPGERERALARLALVELYALSREVPA